MVIWLFAGGGESEVRGLKPFLDKHFAACVFVRMTPARRKPGPKPGRPVQGYGRTGPSLAADIRKRLNEAMNRNDPCDAILVVDDLDCRDLTAMRERFAQSIDSVPAYVSVRRLIAFAAPELEAWIIADWDNSLARHPDFRGRHETMRHWLSTEKAVPFAAPETFGAYCATRDTCREKLSQAIVEASMTITIPAKGLSENKCSTLCRRKLYFAL